MRADYMAFWQHLGGGDDLAHKVFAPWGLSAFRRQRKGGLPKGGAFVSGTVATALDIDT
jgi:hypothetical protein